MQNRIQGALFGLAIGDALGGTTEFMSPFQIKEQYGQLTELIGGGVWHLEPGETTDDTAMTIAVAKGILAAPEDPIPPIGEEFLVWWRTVPKDVGTIISTVFKEYRGDWKESAKAAHHKLGGKSAGNGSLMRCLPVALAYSNKDKMELVTIEQSKMTHYDTLADEACLLYNRIAYRVLKDENLMSAIQHEVKGTRYEEVLHRKPPQVAPDGFVVNTLLWVLHLLLTSANFEEVVVRAANNGFDSDTVGAIAGGLAGLYYGFEALPERYVSAILRKKELLDITERLYVLRQLEAQNRD